MFAELITSLAPVLVTAVLLVPEALCLAAMLFEGARPPGRRAWS